MILCRDKKVFNPCHFHYDFRISSPSRHDSHAELSERERK